jgi:hypothetical protein
VVEAFSAVVAVVALLASVMQQKRSNALQQKLADVEDRRVAERESDRRRESALGISAWWAEVPRGAESNVWGVVVANAQHFPVNGVKVDLTSRGSETQPLELQVLPPGQWLFLHGKRSGKWQLNRDASHALPVMRSADTTVLSIEFTDAAGDRWRRAGGTLEQVDGSALKAQLGSTQ